MSEETKIARAELVELKFKENGDTYKPDDARTVTVQFNPQTLTVNYQNQKSGNDKQGASGVQYVGQGSTSLSVDLLFDVTRPTGDASSGGGNPPKDVRDKTKEVNAFMSELEEGEKEGQYVPPGIRFSWGSFLFEGVMDSMSETLEFFSPEGRPLRATVSIGLSKQEIYFRQQEAGEEGRAASLAETGGSGESSGSNGEDPETRPPGAENTSGTSMQQLAGEKGRPSDWKKAAQRNGIDNPRSIQNPNAVSL